MDELVLTAATQLVQLAATSGWATARDAVLALWRRGQPDQVDAVDAALEHVRRQAVHAGGPEDPATQALVTAWRERFEELLATNPELASELGRVVDEVLRPADSRQPIVMMRATANDHGRVYQSGGTMNIHG